MKSSKLERRLSTEVVYRLYAIKAGMAANKPMAVAIKASEMPCATVDNVA